MKTLYCLICCMLFYTLSINNNLYALSLSVNTHKSQNRENVFVYEKIYNSESIKVVIRTTCLKDSVYQEERRIFNPVVIRQEAYIYNKDSLIKKIIFPLRKIYQRTIHMKKVLMQENVIVSMKVYENKGKYIFLFTGYGGCNTCSEYFSMYDSKGERLYEHYFESNNTYIKYGRSISFILKRFNINQNEWKSELDMHY